MDWLMLVILACSSDPCEPQMLMRPSSWEDCAEQARLVDSGETVMTEWEGELRPIVVTTCIPMAEAIAQGLVAEAGS